MDYRALNTGKSPTKRQPPTGNFLQNDSLLPKESMAWDNTFDINRPSINPWNPSQIKDQDLDNNNHLNISDIKNTQTTNDGTIPIMNDDTIQPNGQQQMQAQDD